MKNSDELRFLVKIRKGYRKVCKAALFLGPRFTTHHATLKTAKQKNTVTPATTINTDSLFSWTVEDWYSLCQWLLVVITAALGLATLVLGKIVNNRQASQIEALHQRQEPRYKRIYTEQFVNFLKGKPAGTATIWVVPENEEAISFATLLGASLSSGKWNVKGTVQLSPNPAAQSFNATTFTIATQGLNVSSGIVIRSADLSDFLNANTPVGALRDALERVGLGPGGVPDKSRPKDDVIIIIGPRM